MLRRFLEIWMLCQYWQLTQLRLRKTVLTYPIHSLLRQHCTAAGLVNEKKYREISAAILSLWWWQIWSVRRSWVTNEITNGVLQLFPRCWSPLWSNTDICRRAGDQADNLSLLPWECGLWWPDGNFVTAETLKTISHPPEWSQLSTITLTRFIHSIAPSHYRPTSQKPVR